MIGSVCFVLASAGEAEIGFINRLAGCGCKVTAILRKEIFPEMRSRFSEKIRLYNAPMSASAKAGKYFGKLHALCAPTVTFCFEDAVAEACLSGQKISSIRLCAGDTLCDPLQFAGELEERFGVCFIVRFEAMGRAVRAAMSLPEKLKAGFCRKSRVMSLYEARNGKALNIEKPETYNEKLNYLKIYGKRLRLRRYADKARARKAVARAGYGGILNECYAVVARRIQPQLWEKLPPAFAIRRSNASGFNILIRNKAEASLEQVNRALAAVSRVDYGLLKNEPVYPPRGKFVIERLLQGVTDYKFFCFGGKAEFVTITHETEQESDLGEPYQYIVNGDFQELPFTFGYERGPGKPGQPECFAEMKRAAEALSAKFLHVRVDFLCSGSAFWFGEFTFFPGGGSDRFHPPQYDKIIGSRFPLG